MNTPLESQKCVACEGGQSPLTADQVKQLIVQVPEWQVDDACKSIKREFKFKNFFRTMSFVNALAHVANREGHHPDFEVGYNYCNVLFTTHAVDGLTPNDFICARKVDLLLNI